MAISTLDGAIAGMQYPREFVKAAGGTMVAGRPHSFFGIAGIPPAASLPANVAVTSSSVANPTNILCGAVHGLAGGDVVSISGHTGSTPALDGTYSITYVNTTNFTIPVNVTVGGTGGVCCSINKGAGAGTAGLTGQVLTSPYSGQIPFSNPVSGSTYLARFQGMVTIAGTLMLCDRLWQNGGISPTITTEQIFYGSAGIPSRDADGTSLGNQVCAAVEVYSALGNGTPTFTLKYTNSDGTAGRTTTNINTTANTPTAGDMFLFSLAAGDSGIRKCESIQASGTYTSGTYGVILYRVLARLEVGALVPNAIDALTAGFPKLYNDSVPFIIFVPNTTTTSNVMGHVIWTQG